MWMRNLSRLGELQMSGYKTILVNHEKYNALISTLNGCGRCEYEEADGELFRHCTACQLRITTLTFELFNDSKRQLMADDTLRRASMGEEPLRSPSVDAGEAVGKIESVKKNESGGITITLDLSASEFVRKLRRAADALEREFSAP
jgi:hypothetical protein